MTKPGAWRNLYPFSSQYISLGPHRMHYLDEGEGETVVMVHGNPSWSFMWRELVLALRHSHRVVAPDHIGCGLSDKPSDKVYPYRLAQRIADFTRLMETLDLEHPVTLVLHDWGGPIGLGYAVRHPEKVGRLVLLNTAGFTVPASRKIHWTLRACRRSRMLAFLIRRFNLFSLGAVWLGCRRLPPAAVRKGYAAPYDSWANRIATLRFVQDIPLEPEHPSYPALLEIQEGLAQLRAHPFLICWGLRDFVFDRGFLEEWRRRFPDAEVHEFAEAGHYALEDAPEEVIPPIIRFLRLSEAATP